MLETLDYTIRIGSTPTFLYLNLFIEIAVYANAVVCGYLNLWEFPAKLRPIYRGSGDMLPQKILVFQTLKRYFQGFNDVISKI